MDYSYVLTPFCAWSIAGVLKFITNSIREKTFAFNLIGYGGFPSNHTAIVGSTVCLIALKEGLSHPAFGAAITLGFIVILDAKSLRNQVGRHAKLLNILSNTSCIHKQLRERIGHTVPEILGGIIVGMFTAIVIYNM